MTTLRPLKIGLILVGLASVAFWMGWLFADAGFRGRSMREESKFDQLAFGLLHIYHRDHGAFPPTKYQPVAGGPIHSWRVLMVPITSGDKRYSKYDFSQEWNSTNNLQALRGWEAPNRRVMPGRYFGTEGDSDITAVLAIGDDDDWPSGKPLRALLVKKGKDRFLLVEDPDSEIHWMEPKY